MEGEWAEYTIDEFADVVGGGTPSTADERNFGGSIPWITPKDLSSHNFRRIERGERNITEKGLNSSNATFLPTGAVLLSSRAPVGYLAIAANPVTTNQGFKTLVVRNGFDNEFVFYLLKANVDYLKSQSSGTTFGELSAGTLKKLKFILPPLPEQRAIAQILGTLDDNIELNHRMNDTLEATARALFKSWFVDFDPVRAKAEGRDPGLPAQRADLFPDSFEDPELGEMPKDWQVGTLADYSSLNPESWSRDSYPETIEYVDLANTKWGRIETTTTYARNNAPSRALRVLRPGDTIVGTVRPGNGSFAQVADEGLTGSTGFAVLRARAEAYREIVYLAGTAPENIERLAHLADGAAYPAVRPDVVLATDVVKPTVPVIEWFSSLTKPLLAKMAQNERESRTLAALRDALLPKFISGELRIQDAERTIGGIT